MKKTDKIAFAVSSALYFVAILFAATHIKKSSFIAFGVIVTALYLVCAGYFLYKYASKQKQAKKARLERCGATMSGTLKHVSGLPLAKGLMVEMFYGTEKITFKKDGQEINISRDKVTGIDVVAGDNSGRKAVSGAASGKYVAGGAGAMVGAFAAIDTYLVISYTSEGQNKSIRLDTASSGMFPTKVAKDFQQTHQTKHTTIDL